MAKKLIAIVIVLMLCVGTAVMAAGEGTGAAVYRDETLLAEGFTYINEVSYTTVGRRVETHTLVDSGEGVYPIVMANDTIYGSLNADEMISYAESQGYRVVAAINGDFGYPATGVPTGMVVEDGVYKSSPEGNNALGYMADGSAFVSFMPEVNITFTNTTTGAMVTTTHLNKTRTDFGLFVYTEYFSTVSTRTTGQGRSVRMELVGVTEIPGSPEEVALEEPPQLTVSGELKLIVTDVYEGSEAQSIGDNNIILTATEGSGLYDLLSYFEVGDEVTLNTTCTDERIVEAQWVSGGGNIIVNEGEVFHPEWWDSAISGVNPRTIVGIKPDGSMVYQVLDGRSSLSGGATMWEISQDFLSMGCEYAINMDGGGSSIMTYIDTGDTDNSVINDPSDGSPRRVCGYILFVTDTEPSGEVFSMNAEQDGSYIMTGSSVDLDLVASDTAMGAATVPTDVVVAATHGTVDGLTYIAGAESGVDDLVLSSAAQGVSSVAQLHVISSPDYMTVWDEGTGKVAADTVLDSGETLELDVTASLYGRDVILQDESSVRYTVEGEIGSVDAEGVFTAEGEPSAEGKIIVELGDLRREISVNITFEFPDMKDHWAAEYVKELYELGVVNGVSETEYGPELGLKRGDFILMLYRAAGSPEVSEDFSMPFSDVEESAYYAMSIKWAAEQGIAQGTGEGSFAPEDGLTREQGITFMYRSLAALGVSFEGEPADIESMYEDADMVSDWAVEALSVLSAMGIIEGTDGKVNPQSALTRSQMAKILTVTLYRI